MLVVVVVVSMVPFCVAFQFFLTRLKIPATEAEEAEPSLSAEAPAAASSWLTCWSSFSFRFAIW